MGFWISEGHIWGACKHKHRTMESALVCCKNHQIELDNKPHAELLAPTDRIPVYIEQ